MGTRAQTPLRLLIASAGLGVMACQASDLTLPADGSPARLNVVSGDGQQGTVGDDLPKPLVVRVTDATGRPVPEINLRFETGTPGARVNPSVIATDSSGVVAVQVRLGSIEGVQTVEASLSDAAQLATTVEFMAVGHPPRDGDDGDGDDDDGDGGGSAGNGDDNGNGNGNGDRDGRGRGRSNGNGGDDDDD